VGCRPEYQVSPSPANVGELVPPTFAVPLAAFQDTVVVILIVF
jgi:hypothetical protein